jgi:hypothetical protein
VNEEVLAHWGLLRQKQCLRLIKLNALNHRRVISEQKVKGGGPPVHAMKTYMGSRGIALLIRNLGTVLRGWVVNITPRPFHLHEKTLISF